VWNIFYNCRQLCTPTGLKCSYIRPYTPSIIAQSIIFFTTVFVNSGVLSGTKAYTCKRIWLRRRQGQWWLAMIARKTVIDVWWGGWVFTKGGRNRVERCSRNLIVRSAGKRSGLPWRWDYGLAHLTLGSRGALFIGNNILRLSHFRAAEHFYSVVLRFISFLYILFCESPAQV